MNILMGIAQGMVIIRDILDSHTPHGGIRWGYLRYHIGLKKVYIPIWRNVI